MTCVLIFMCDVCCTSKNPLPVGDVWRVCNAMQTGRYGAWLSTVAGQMLTGHQACPLQMMRGVQTYSAADGCCLGARHSLGSAQNCPGPTGLQRSVCKLGAKESHR